MPGFEVAAASSPGLGQVLRHFSPDPFWLAVLVAVAAVYGWGAATAAGARNSPHPWWRSALFAAGVASLAAATLSPLNHYGDQLLWANFTGFLVLTMVAAPLMLLGAPVTLFFRVADAGGRRRARKWLASRAVRTVTFPITAWLLFAVVTYVWQFTSLTEAAARNPVARDVQQSTLLVVALTFWAPALCADPGLLRMGYPLRILYVFLEMTHKGLFGGMFLSMSTPFHGWYAANAPAWAPSAMTDQRIAIVVLWIGGNLVFLAVLVGLAIRWIQYEGRVSARIDRRLADWRAAERRRQAALATVFKRP